MPKTRKKTTGECPHPPSRMYSWFARDLGYSEEDGVWYAYESLQIVCCECGAVLSTGAAPFKGRRVLAG